MVNTCDNQQNVSRTQKSYNSNNSKRQNNINILEIQKFDTTESKSKHLLSSPKSERESQYKYVNNQLNTKKVTDTPKRLYNHDINRHGSPNLGKTNPKNKSNENKRKSNFSEEYNHRRKCWEKVIHSKIAETKKKQTPDLKNIMNSKCFMQTKDCNNGNNS